MKKNELWEAIFGCWMLYVLSQFGNSTIHFIPYLLVAYGCRTPNIWFLIPFGFLGILFIIDGVLSAYTEVHHYVVEYIIAHSIGFERFMEWGKIFTPVVAVIGCCIFIYSLLVKVFLLTIPFALFTIYTSYVAYMVNTNS